MSDNVPPGAFRFLDIPMDIRFMVYDEYFVATTATRVVHIYNPVMAEYHTGNLHECEHGFDPKESTLTVSRSTVPSALLCTNRTIHREAQTFRDRQLARLLMPNMSIHAPCYRVYDEIPFFLSIIYGLVYAFRAHPTGKVKFDDVVDAVRRSWRRRGWKFLDGKGGEELARAWATDVAYRMATQTTDKLPCQVSWPDHMLAQRLGCDTMFAGFITRYVDGMVDLKMQ